MMIEAIWKKGFKVKCALMTISSIEATVSNSSGRAFTKMLSPDNIYVATSTVQTKFDYLLFSLNASEESNKCREHVHHKIVIYENTSWSIDLAIINSNDVCHDVM